MISTNELFNYCLMLADDRLILSHRLSQQCGHGPYLEEDIALTNIALDLLGQATEFYTYAGTIEDKSADELAYLRLDTQFKNVILSELENDDFAWLIARQFFFDNYSFLLYTELLKSKDETIAAIAEKSLKEDTYHLRHSKKWFHILADGTEESRNRLIEAIDDLWTYTFEMLESNPTIDSLVKQGIAADLNIIKEKWLSIMKENFAILKLEIPDSSWMQSGGREGKHSEHLGRILTEMQYMQRAFPNAEW